MKPIIGITMSLEENKQFTARQYTDAIIQAGGIPVLLPYTVDQTVINQWAHYIDGLLLTGGGDIDPILFDEEPIPGLGGIEPERDEMEIALIEQCMVHQKPIFGICRGCQILNVALGGDMYQDLPSQKQELLQHSQRAPRSHGAHLIRIEENTLLHQIIGKISTKVNTYHHQANRNPAPSLRVSATASDGVVEAVEGTSYPFMIGVQWHPEHMTQTTEDAKKLFQAFVQACK
ncbi:putative glutamine amidotransferase [Hazenella coriacea]|uniref:Putative glutamine amidotransferase n=2 Tax=Hazenella coriacea TaxID=1179467 RepID=A0A4R3L6K0_9BACL|nr:gamma-glutamyl-gamma-aminobutyrate hydrolase family protein [Hazenella coriacea]TCS94698.1 putative glutamine amidotransferase [Hazenella coriacea]